MVNDLKKIGIGTVQFGLNYGISNNCGKTKKTELEKIFDICSKNSINTLDTAYVYGNSEEVLGAHNISEFNIISKYADNGLSVKKQFQKSLKRLNTTRIYAYLFHHFKSFKSNTNTFKMFQELKEKGLVKKIGFSLNEVSEIEYILEKNIDIDIVQLPINIFDQEFINYLPILKEKKIEIHSRSSFLQGLIFVNSSNLNSFFNPIKSKLDYFQKEADLLGCSKIQLALYFLFHNQFIDKIILGVNDARQLKENIKDINGLKNYNFDDVNFLNFRINDYKYTKPYNWQIK